MTKFRAALLLSTLIATVGQAHAGSPVPTPEAVIGTAPGTDYFVANYDQISAWLKAAAAASDRIKLVSIGKTVEGRDQYMAVISSPANLARLDHWKDIARKLALGQGKDDAEARTLAKEGRAVVWLGAGVHANEVVNGQAYPQIIHGLLTGQDEETLAILDNVVAMFTFANPDGLDLIARWYMSQPEPAKRNTETLPVPYQKYVGHDLNRDGYAALTPENANINRILYREWFPQIVCDQHQPGPVGTIIYIPPANDPVSYNIDPLTIGVVNATGHAIHAGLMAKGLSGSSMRSAAPYSSWYNGSISSTPLFHNAIGILTEITGNPTPMEIALVPRNQLPQQDIPAPPRPGPWHLRQAIDYLEQVDRVLLTHAARQRETLLYDRYVMAQRQIVLGSGDSWTVTPSRIEALYTAANVQRIDNRGSPDEPMKGYDSRDTIPYGLYDKVLRDPAVRNPRAYVIDPGAQHDLSASIGFLNSLIRNGVAVERADAPFTADGKTYPAGSFVVRADQAFRPHILDMFEPQVYPHDLAYPGGPPVKPYDIAGYTPALQAGVSTDRIIDAPPAHFPAMPDEIAMPAGRILGEGKAGYVLDHRSNTLFTLTNRLLKAKIPAYWLKEEITLNDRKLQPGALWIPASQAARILVEKAAASLGLDAYRVAVPPSVEAMRLRPLRIGLVDIYGGSLVSGWTRWLLENHEFDYRQVFPQEIDKGGLRKKFDLILVPSDVFGGRGTHARKQPAAADIPVRYRSLLGPFTAEKSVASIKAFAEQGGAVIATGAASRLGQAIGLPLRDPMVEPGPDGAQRPISKDRYYIPGSLLSARFNPRQPLAYGMPKKGTIFFADSPVFTLNPGPGTTVQRAGWFDTDKSLISGWAIGERRLAGTTLAARFGYSCRICHW